MKRAVSIFLITLLVIPFASASIFDWITGRVTEDANVQEQVKCVFVNSNSEQKCYTDDGRFSCSGIESCIAEISGEKDTKLTWKSNCDGYTSAVIDGNNENIEFKCPLQATLQEPIVEETSTAEIVKEQVKCTFLNSNSEQKCYTDDGKFACSGIGICAIYVSGQQGQQLHWKNSCGSEAYTKIDGVDDSMKFNCEPIGIKQPTSTETIAVPEGAIYEEVTCDFAYSNAIQQCYSEDKKFSCSGKDRCLAKIYGNKGERIIFKGTCKEGYNEILIDGVYNNVWFNCEQQTQTPTPQPIAIPAETLTETLAETVKERVKCIFKDSECQQECHLGDSKFSCSGIGNCVVDISGQKGAQVTWGSSCGGYAYTIMDGNNENAEFNCGPGSASTCIKDKVKLHYFYWEKYCPLCESEKSFIEKLKLKYPQVEYDSYSIDNAPGTYTYFVVSNLKQGMPTIFFDDKIWIGYDNNIAAEIESKVKYCLEKGCSLTPAVPAASTTQATQTSIPLKPVQEVQQTAQIPNTVKEQVECIFWNSDVLVNPHTARPEKCHTDDGRFGCIWTGNVVEKEIDEKRVRYAHCIAEVFDASGTQLIWKSSCGGYAYTITDGNNEAAEFKCIPSSEVKEEQISGKGFKRAYWQCYDGAEQKSVVSASVSCKSSDVWQKEAEEFCRGHCYADGSKCGVNSFSVMDECYIEAAKEGVIFAVPEKPKGGKKFAMPPNSKIGDIMVVYFYSDACRHCTGMNEELDKVSKELNINIRRVSVINEPELVESYGIKGVPALLILKYYSDGIKEYLRHGKADSTAIINWITKPTEVEVQEKPAEIDKVKEEILVICKDSCPLDGKCYPFGYRKGGNFCSDEGEFREQLEADSICENSFECSTNVCVDGKCISSGLIQKIVNWFKKLFVVFGGEEAKEEITETVDCGASSECMENAFKVCKPAKISQQQGGPISEIAIVGLEGKKCVLKMTGSTEMTGGAESMTCKFENYALGLKDVGPGSLEQYCSGPLTYWLASSKTLVQASAPETESSTEIQPQQTKQENIQEPISAQQQTPALEQVSTTPVSSKLFKEQVRCKFIDPDLIQRCYADFGKLGCSNLIRKCYTDDSKFECSDITIASTPLEGGGFKYVPFCVAEVQGEQGTKLTWKASCGESSYTVLDRNNEDITFMCMPAGSQIKGFLHAYWKCGNGVEEKSIEGVDLTTCKSSEIWKEYAAESCKNQGGIKDFSVSEECSIDVQKEGVFIST